MKIGWRHYIMPPNDGAARGYLQSAFYLWQALRHHPGVEVVDGGSQGAHPKVLLHYCPPHFFRRVAGKRNVLFTMWEADVLPEHVVDALNAADELVVPSHYCRRVWEANGVKTPMVVPLGVDTAFTSVPTERRLVRGADEGLRFLFVGSAIARKGWAVLAKGWVRAFGEGGAHGHRLTVKTVGDGSVKTQGAVTADQRDLEPVDLLRLYLDHDAFVFPSFGEGFGLPALEAMATGCLVLAPAIGGLTEFVADSTAVVIPRSLRAPMRYGTAAAFELDVAGPDDVAQALRVAAEDWGTGNMEARRAAGVRAARAFTWEASADALVRQLESVTGVRAA